MRTITVISVLLLTASVALCEEQPQAKTADKASTERADADPNVLVGNGLDYLVGIQKEDGSWSNGGYPAMTALGLWAFSRSDHAEKKEVCEKAAAYIEQFAQDDGGIYKKPGGLLRRSGGLSSYNTAICMIALQSYDEEKYTPLLLKAREFMAKCQVVGDSGGGFGYNAPGPDGKLKGRDRPDLSNTGWATHAMRVTQGVEDSREGETVDIDWDAAIEFVSKLQNQDSEDKENYGGFAYGSRGERGGVSKEKDGKVALRGYGSMTYAGIESMIFAQVDLDDPRVRSAIDWAARHWSVDENPGMGQRGLFYYFNIMSKALALSGQDTLKNPGSGEMVAWKQDLVNKLGAEQREDGSWVNEDNHFWEGDPMLATVYSVLTLQYTIGK